MRTALIATMCVVTAFCAAARAQCTPHWLPGDGVPGVHGVVNASVLWDPDGAGPQQPQLVVGGYFAHANNVVANNIARWNGSAWEPFGTGIAGGVYALAVLPNGELVAGGGFASAGGVDANAIARWN